MIFLSRVTLRLARLSRGARRDVESERRQEGLRKTPICIEAQGSFSTDLPKKRREVRQSGDPRRISAREMRGVSTGKVSRCGSIARLSQQVRPRFLRLMALGQAADDFGKPIPTSAVGLGLVAAPT
jgi:hypothetical protein